MIVDGIYFYLVLVVIVYCMKGNKCFYLIIDVMCVKGMFEGEYDLGG